ncbi:hypothetical protein K2W90_04880 [Candidatus Babeliales bacterium]|nr:hypothetical protein [Candidatus Babeliales bacterium]
MNTKHWYALAIFIIVFSIGALPVDKIWYREDDLGQIINGLIFSKEDALRVIKADEREFIVPMNYRRSKPNFISGFLRPLKHFFFTVVYALCGLEAKAYYLLHVIFHALNAVLLFYLFSQWLSVWLSLLGGLMFGLYPDISWLVWLATFHNSLATFFLLLSGLLFCFFWQRHGSWWYYFFSGFSFLLSLLARENGIFFPLWLFFGMFLYALEQRTCWQSVLYAVRMTWIFFVVHMIYVVWRLWAFGITTLERTLNNFLIRLPFLAALVQKKIVAVAPILPNSAAATVGVVPTQPVFLAASWYEPFLVKLDYFFTKFFAWSSCIFMFDYTKHFLLISLWFLLILFCSLAYKNHKKLLLFFIVGFWCFAWQGVMAYPCARYLETAYPLVVTLVVVGIPLLNARKFMYGQYGVLLVSFFILVSIGRGALLNMHDLRIAGQQTYQLKKRYEPFFLNNKLDPKAQYIFFSSPFVSDIQSIVHYFLNDLTVNVAFELFSSLAEKGVFGCDRDYKIVGVSYRVLPIPGGFRLISDDPQHCAWWMQFSNHPLQWNARDFGYEWRSEPYLEGEWYQCSMGSFMINQRIDGRFITDISFVFDKKWLTKNTVFVVWDTQKGGYTILKADHLQPETTQVI